MDQLFTDGSDRKDGLILKRLASCEAIINESSGFFGTKMYPGDCAFAASIDLIVKLEPGILGQYPKTKCLYEKVLATDPPAFEKLMKTFAWPYFKRKSDPA
jgi:hypothetical protein